MYAISAILKQSLKEKPAMENIKITVGAKKASGLRLSHLLSFSKP